MTHTALAIRPVANGSMTQLNQTITAHDTMNGAQKAAVIVQALLSEGASLSLSTFSKRAQHRFAETFSAIEQVDKSVLDQVITDFETALDGDRLRFAATPRDRLTALSGVLSDGLADQATCDLGLSTDATLWRDLGAMTIDDLRPMLETESPRIAAVILSKLPPARASEILAALDNDLRQTLTTMMAKTDGIGTQIAKNIALTLVQSTKTSTDNAFDTDPIARMAAVLDASKPAVRDTILQGLTNDDPNFAKQVRAAIFTFEDIPARVGVADVPAIVRQIANDDLVLALGFGATNATDTVKHILGNMSGRMAAQLKEEIEEMGDIKPDHGEAAQSRMAAAVRGMADSGAIKLVETVDADAMDQT